MFESGSLRIGAFRCSRDHPSFEDSGPAQSYCFVFPRTAVEIEHEHERAFAANPNVVTFYNLGQTYRRRAISSDGDRCDWFGVSADVARDALRGYDPRVDERPETPFRLSRGWSDPRTYFLQRRLFQEANNREPLAVEEEAIALLDRVLRCTYGRAPAHPPPTRRDAIHHIEVVLSKHWHQPLSLRDLAAEAGLSMYYLCRMFRRATGTSLQQHRRRLRILSALECVCESRRPLIDIAIGAGFSSHSHFTSDFRRVFGRRPSDLRAARF